ncbi:MAG: alpha/beta fold hydrolase [Acidimicrobiales bacterium]|nr:alpha/beta fold hydrolase [Acidimicrobiales bacterium]
MPSVRVGDTEVAYEVMGDGEPMVFLHGTTQTKEMWLLHVPALAGQVRAVLVDLPGSGSTTDAGGPLELDDLAELVVAVADDAGADRFHLVGYSLGAVVAATTAAAAPERVRTLSLIAGWATTDQRMRFTFGLWRHLIATDPVLFNRYAYADGFTAEFFEMAGDMVESMLTVSTPEPGSDRQLELDQRVDIADRLAAISAPTLVVGGLEDRWVDVRHSRHLASAIPEARLVELDAGHLLYAERAPQLVELLAQHARQG